jgi:hypothetical protein
MRPISPTDNRGTVFSGSIAGGLLAALALGSSLRLYCLSDQILLDDEWHAIAFARAHSFFDALINVNIGANSPVVNLYTWLALHTYGYSEWILRLPSLGAGLLSLVLMPLLVRSIITCRAAVVFAFLLAVSPSLIYYSRLSRSYGGYVLFGFLALLFLYFWAIRGTRKWAVGFVILGCVSVYSHLLAAVAVAIPLAVVWLARLLAPPGGRLPLQHRVVLGWPALLGGTIAAGLFVSLAALPALHGYPMGAVMAHPDQVTIETLLNAASLVSGTGNPLLAAIFWSLVFHGLVLLWRRDRLLTGMFLAVASSYVAMLSVIHGDDIHVAMVLVRYCILLLPISFFLAAISVDWILSRFAKRVGIETAAARSVLNTLGVGALMIGLILTGPLPRIYRHPNNFTNHFAYQQSYAMHDRNSSNSAYSFATGLNAATMSSFYRTLGTISDDFSIIEYPMFIGNDFNLHYYSQHFHRKRTLIGYVPMEEASPAPNFAYAYMFPDEIIGRMPNKKWLKLKNVICMTDVSALRKSGARYVVLHPHLLTEGIVGLSTETKYRVLRANKAAIEPLLPLYRKAFGPPAFADQNLLVFEIAPWHAADVP